LATSARNEYASRFDYFDGLLPKECANCESTTDLHIHHIVPISLGGANKPSNMARLCSDCHAKAHGGLSFVAQTNESARRRASEGKASKGSVPFGYKANADGYFEPVEEDAEIVRLIFRLRYQFEYSTTNIATYLNYMAIPTARGAKKWAHPPIKRIVENAKYFGEYMYSGENYGQLIPPILSDDMRELKKMFEKKYERTRLRPRKLALPEER